MRSIAAECGNCQEKLKVNFMEAVMIKEATIENLKQVVDIVMRYRAFYGVDEQRKEDVESFMKSRFENRQSKVFIATSENDEVIGFIQLYPSYSTVSLKPQWILNDFFVDKNYRKQGYGTKLMEYVKTYFEDSAKGFILVTDKDNVTAKSFYDKNGWKTGAHDLYTYFYK